MSIKYIGMFLIFAACTALGFVLACGERKKINNNEALVCLLRYIRQRIGYFKSYPSEIFESFKNQTLEKSGFMKSLKEHGLYGAIEECNCFELDETTENSLIEYSQMLGKSPLSEQIALCDYIIEVLEEYNKVIRENSPAKQKVYSSLGMLCGIMAVIVLL